MGEGCLPRLRALLVQLETGEGPLAPEEADQFCNQFVELGGVWPDTAAAENGEAEAFERLGSLLQRFPENQQGEIVSALRPLRKDVRKRLLEATVALNSCLGQVRGTDIATHERIVGVLTDLQDTLQVGFYKQCASLDEKARFLMALGSVLRAVKGAAKGRHSPALVAAQHLAAHYFATPEHGDVLDVWHEGRLERYNATLWRAGRRAANRLKDELQMQLASALQRAVQAPPPGPRNKAGHYLQLELKAWPMVGCPLARTFINFIKQRYKELGDVGKPRLSECPEHSMRPATLKRLLARLDAFEVLDGDNSKGSQAPFSFGTVRLRVEAVTALAFKAVGTKPKAAAFAPPGSAPHEVAPTPRVHRSTQRPLAAQVSGQPSLAGIDWNNSRVLRRIVRYGLSSGDPEWRKAWLLHCRQRRLPIELSHASPSDEVVADFMRKQQPKLLKKEWLRNLLPRDAGRGDANTFAETEAPEEVSGTAGRQAGLAIGAAGIPKAAPETAGVKRCASGSAESSSGSDSSRSKQRRKKRKKEKRKLMMTFGDYFARGKGGDLNLSKVMMMNQMMNMSMMMNSPLAMMGMGAPMMAHQLQLMPTSSGLKVKKEDKSKKEKADDKTKKSADTTPVKAPTKDGKADWNKRADAMIDADDL